MPTIIWAMIARKDEPARNRYFISHRPLLARDRRRGGRRRFWRTEQDQDFFHADQVGARLNPDGSESGFAFLRIHDFTDRQPLRVDAVQTGGEDDIADIHLFGIADVIQVQQQVFGAAHNSRSPGALDHHPDRGIAIRNQLDLAAVGGDQHRAPDDAGIGEHRLVAADAVRSSPVQVERIGQEVGRSSDNPRSDRLEGQPRR